jgi:hypothetical protein
MGRLRTEEKIGIEVDDGICPTRAVNSDRNPGVRALPQVSIHAQGNLDILFLRQENLSHRDRLERILRNLPQNRGCIETDLRAFRRRETRLGRRSVVTHHVMQRRLQVGVTESLDDDSVDVR